MFTDMSEVIEANEAIGHHFFEPDTMAFFESKVETKLFKNQCFITSEKACFEDYTRVYTVRQVNERGAISTVARGFDSLGSALHHLIDI